MANPEHLQIVHEGVERLGRWRAERPRERLDLAGAALAQAALSRADLACADLRGAELAAADLRGADLREANLRGADLAEADLSGADCRDADLRDARLARANLALAVLAGANLAGADLEGASLAGANLNGAHLVWTRLAGANLARALCWDTTFGALDLSETQGLAEVFHAGPSTLGVDTLARSDGRLPREFLRGCGVPEVLAHYLPAHLAAMGPAQRQLVFISHDDADQAFAERLRTRLAAEGLSVWAASELRRGGRKTYEPFAVAIGKYDRIVIALSPHSMASRWIGRELHLVRRRERERGERVLVPVRLAGEAAVGEWSCAHDGERDLAAWVRGREMVDFTRWTEDEAFEDAVARLARRLREPAAAGPVRRLRAPIALPLLEDDESPDHL